MSKSPTKQSYFDHRMKEIGFDPEKDVAPIDFHPDEPLGSTTMHPVFWEAPDRGICIGLLDLEGKLLTTDVKERKRRWLSNIDHQPLYIKRKPPGAAGPKYLPGIDGMGVWPYLTLPVIEAFKKHKVLETLYLTEGYFKSFVLAKNGFPAIGLPGITVWKERTEKELFYYIRMVLEVCKPKRIVYITDADTFELKFEVDKDLGQRPNNFYTSIKLYKKLFQDYKANMIWKSIRSEADAGKGIDDVILGVTKKERKTIFKELSETIPEQSYFQTWDVGAMTYTGLKEQFSINSPTAFYHRYEYEIGLNEFIFFRAKYKWSESEAKVKKLKSEFAAMMLMIGSTIYKKATKPMRNGSMENVLLEVTEKQLLKICGSEPVKKEVFHELDYYDGAINIPAHHDYQQFVTSTDAWGNESRWYNMYRPVTWQPAKGPIGYSMKMIKHIFGEEPIDYKGEVMQSYELGLDYMQLLWVDPKHYLPLLTLYSRERHTGKTTFWDWCRAIFQQNVKSVRPEHLTGQFTSFFAGALLVIIDEALVDKKATMERIKGMVTAKKGTLEAKHRNAEEIDAFTKVGMGTNNDNFAQIDEEEIRFWIRKVPAITGEYNFDMLDCLVKEIPAFLHHLENREMATSRASRAWFDPALLETKELVKMKKEGKWRIEKEIEEAISTHFAMVKVPELGLSTRDLKKLVDNPKNTNADYRNVLENRMQKTKKPFSVKYEVYEFEYNEFTSKTKDGMPYFFLITEFFKPAEILQILPDNYLIELENKHQQKFWSKNIGIQNVKCTEIAKSVAEVLTDQQLSEIIKLSESFNEFHENLREMEVDANGVPF